MLSSLDVRAAQKQVSLRLRGSALGAAWQEVGHACGVVVLGGGASGVQGEDCPVITTIRLASCGIGASEALGAEHIHGPSM